MSSDDRADTREAALSPCHCSLHPPIIIRRQLSQQLNEQIHHLLGIQTLRSESLATTSTKPLTEIAMINSVISPYCTNANANAVENHKSARSFDYTQVCNVKKCPSGSSSSRLSSPLCSQNEVRVHQQSGLSTSFQEDQVAQPELSVTREQSQDEFAELWADFGSLHAVISNETSLQSSSVSDNPQLHHIVKDSSIFLNANVSAGISHIPAATVSIKDDCNTKGQLSPTFKKTESTSTVLINSNSEDFALSSKEGLIAQRTQLKVESVPTNSLGFSTASGKAVSVSAHLLEKAQQLFNEEMPSEIGFSTTSFKFGPISSELESEERNTMLKSKVELPKFSGECHSAFGLEGPPMTAKTDDETLEFATASGTPVVITDGVRSDARSRILNATVEDMNFDESPYIEAERGYVSVPSLKIEMMKTKEIEFAVSLAESATSTDKRKDNDQIMGPNCPKFMSSPIPSKELALGQKRMGNSVIVHPDYSFSTGAGCPVTLTDEMVTKGERILNIHIPLETAIKVISENSPKDETMSAIDRSPIKEKLCAAKGSQSRDEPPSMCNIQARDRPNDACFASSSSSSGLSAPISVDIMPNGATVLGEDIRQAPLLKETAKTTSIGRRLDITGTVISSSCVSSPALIKLPEKSPSCEGAHHTAVTHEPVTPKQTCPHNRYFGDDITNAQKSPVVLPAPKPSCRRQVLSTSKRLRERPSLLSKFKTPSPLTKVQNSLAAVNLYTPSAAQIDPVRKRLKFTPPVFRLPSNSCALPIPSPKKPINTIGTTQISNALPKFQKFGLKEFANKLSSKKFEEFSDYVPSPDIQMITSTSSILYSFPDGRNWKDVFNDLAQSGANTVWASKKWVMNHYRWVVWKFASMERRFRIRSLDYNRTYKQVHHRYEQEFLSSRRSCLKLITEHDRAPGGFLVLCVASVDYSSNTIELTDGWYSIFADLDTGLKTALAEGKLFEGLKLRLFNCVLIGELSPCTPLENTSMKIRLSINSIRRAPWHARLGFQPAGPFLVSLSSLKPNGGLAPKLQLSVLRVLPTQFTEKILSPSGKCSKFITRTVVRNQIGEDEASKIHDNQLTVLEDAYRDRLLEESVEHFVARIRSMKSILPDFAEKIARELEDTDSEKVLDVLREKVCSRNVSIIRRYLVESARTESSPIRRLYILNISNADLKEFRVGDVVTATHLDCCSGPYQVLLLSSSPRSQFRSTSSVLGEKKSDFVFEFNSRHLPTGLLFDVVGFLVLRTARSVVICSPGDCSELLIVQLGDEWRSPKITTGQLVKIENIFYNRYDSRYSIHSTVGRGTALICIEKSENSPPCHFALQCRRARAFVDPTNFPIMEHQAGALSISHLLVGNLEMDSKFSFAETNISFIVDNSSVLAKSELLLRLLDDNSDAACLTGRRVCVWVVSKIEQDNLLIAEAIELL